MKQSQGTIGPKIARAARAFEKRRTMHGRKWVPVFMNEDTIVIAVHGFLTAAEKALAQSPAGAAQVREFHRRLFTNVSAPLHRKTKKISGMEVRDTTAEIEPTTGGAVHVLSRATTQRIPRRQLAAACGNEPGACGFAQSSRSSTARPRSVSAFAGKNPRFFQGALLFGAEADSSASALQNGRGGPQEGPPEPWRWDPVRPAGTKVAPAEKPTKPDV